MGHEPDKIQVPQYEADVTVNLDFYYDEPSPVYIEFKQDSNEAAYVKLDPSANQMAIGRWVDTMNGRIHSDIDTHACTPSLTPDTWFELHICCCDENVRAWYRRTEVGALPGDKWQPEGRALDRPGDLQVLNYAAFDFGPLSFAITVVHDEETTGRWRFDNIALNGYSVGASPQFECAGCSP